MFYKTDAVVVGYGASGIAVMEALKELGVSFLISCGNASETKEIYWENHGFVSSFYDGKLGNLNIWGSCLRKIPFELINSQMKGLKEEEYDEACEKISDLFGVTPSVWQSEGRQLYYHYKKNIAENLIIKKKSIPKHIGKTKRVLLSEEGFILETTDGIRVNCKDVFLCVPIPEVLRIIDQTCTESLDKTFANEHFLYLGAAFCSEKAISPSYYQMRSKNISIRSHLETERVSVLLIPRLFRSSNQSIIKTRREIIKSVLELKWLKLVKLACRFPLEAISLLLWYLNLHPKTRNFDSIVMINREVSITKKGDEISIEANDLLLNASEKSDLNKIAEANDMQVFLQSEPFYENCQHMHGLKKKNKSGATMKLDSNKCIHISSSAGFHIENVSNITYSLMALAYLRTKKYYDA